MIKLFGLRQTTPHTEHWKAPNDDKNKLSLTVLKEIYIEGVVRFDSIIADINLVKSRAYTLLSILISLLGIVVSLYFSNNLGDLGVNSKVLTLLYFINIVVVTYCIVQLTVVISPGLMKVKGEEPMSMHYDALAALSLKKQERTYLENSLTAVQEKIDYNEAIIKNKIERLESVIAIVTIMFIFTLILSLV